MGIRVRAHDQEPITNVIRRLKQQLQLHGMMWEMRRRKWFVEETQLRRAKRFQKRLKARKATLLAKLAGIQTGRSQKEELAEFWRLTGKP